MATPTKLRVVWLLVVVFISLQLTWSARYSSRRRQPLAVYRARNGRAYTTYTGGARYNTRYGSVNGQYTYANEAPPRPSRYGPVYSSSYYAQDRYYIEQKRFFQDLTLALIGILPAAFFSSIYFFSFISQLFGFIVPKLQVSTVPITPSTGRRRQLDQSTNNVNRALEKNDG